MLAIWRVSSRVMIVTPRNQKKLIAIDDFGQFLLEKAITQPAKISIMILHLGLWKIKQDLSPEMLQRITQHVSDFAQSIKGVEVAYAGPVISFELPAKIADTYGISRDMSMLARGYTHVLYIVFKNY